MPKVQQYSPNQVSTNVTRSPRANSVSQDAFGVVSRGGEKALNSLANNAATLSNHFEQQKIKADQTSAEEALVNFERDKNDIFFNKDTGYYNTAGKVAYDKSSEISESLKKLKEKYAESLPSDFAKQSFSRVADQHLMRSDVDIQRHAAKNLKAWEIGTINSQIENTLENSINYWNDPKKLREQSALGRMAVMDAARIEGVSPETLNERLQTYESSFTKASITAALSSSSKDAEALLATSGKYLEGPDRLLIEQKIASRKKAEVEQSQSSMAVLTANNLISTYGDRTDREAVILEQINKIKDGDLQKRVRTEAMTQLNFKNRAEDSERGRIVEVVESSLMNGGTVNQFITTNPEEWQKLTAQQKQALQSGKKIVTDHVKFSELLSLPDDKLAKVNPADHFHYIGQTDRDNLQSAIQSAQKSERGTVGQRNDSTKRVVEIIFGDKDRQNVEQVNSFYRLLDEERVSREAEKGSSLNSREYSDMLSDMTTSYVQKGEWWGTNTLKLKDLPGDDARQLAGFVRTSGVEVNAENILKANELYESISEDDITAITNKLTSLGKEVNKKTILTYYRLATK